MVLKRRLPYRPNVRMHTQVNQFPDRSVLKTMRVTWNKIFPFFITTILYSYLFRPVHVLAHEIINVPVWLIQVRKKKGLYCKIDGFNRKNMMEFVGSQILPRSHWNLPGKILSQIFNINKRNIIPTTFPRTRVNLHSKITKRASTPFLLQLL